MGSKNRGLMNEIQKMDCCEEFITALSEFNTSFGAQIKKAAHKVIAVIRAYGGIDLRGVKRGEEVEFVKIVAKNFVF